MRVFLALLLLPLFATPIARADRELPEVIFSRNATQADLAKRLAYQTNYDRTLAHWRKFGVTNKIPLDSITVIASYEGLRVVELVQILNPELVDVAKHVQEQYDHFLSTRFAQLLVELERKNGLEPGSLMRHFFDSYCRIRYGYGFVNFLQEVKRNPLVEEVYADSSEVAPTDNAYYASYPKMDLTATLPKEDPEGKAYLAWLSLISSSPDTQTMFERLLERKATIARRIVQLPHITERPGDPNMKRLTEYTVPSHELGHSLVRSIADIPRQLDEVSADLFSADFHGTPVMGGGFAENQGIAAERLRAGAAGPLTPELLALIEDLEDTAKRGHIRLLTEEWTANHITRDTKFADNYQGGHPLRTAQWRIRARLEGAHRDNWRRAFTRTIQLVSEQPALISENTMMMLNLRRVQLQLNQEKMLKEETEQQKLAGTLGKKGQRSPGQVVAAKLAGIELLEKKKRLEAVARGENPDRPVIHSDYLNAEYFRMMGLAAQELGDVKLLEAIREEAGRVMSAHAQYVESSSGKMYLVFFRKAADAKRRTLLEKLGRAFDFCESAMTSSSPFTEGRHQYELHRSGIQEFEITGEEMRIHSPWPQAEQNRKSLERLRGSCEGELDELMDAVKASLGG